MNARTDKRWADWSAMCASLQSANVVAAWFSPTANRQGKLWTRHRMRDASGYHASPSVSRWVYAPRRVIPPEIAAEKPLWAE